MTVATLGAKETPLDDLWREGKQKAFKVYVRSVCLFYMVDTVCSTMHRRNGMMRKRLQCEASSGVLVPRPEWRGRRYRRHAVGGGGGRGGGAHGGGPRQEPRRLNKEECTL